VNWDQDSLKRLLREAREAGATDLHFKVPGPPRMRIRGELVPTAYDPLQPAATQRIAQIVLELAGRELPLATLTDAEVGFGIPKEGRFRATLFRQRGSLGVLVHRMALDAPSIESLGAPDDAAAAIWGSPGLVLVCGARGRHALLGALTNAFARLVRGHLLTLEQPIEYLHRDARGAVSQREVRVDVPSFEAGLAGALHDDSDAILTSDLPDAAAAELALRIAEDGRCVVAGLAGCPPAEASQRFIELFPPARAAGIAHRLAAQLRLVVFDHNGQMGFLAPDGAAG
jgi:twitching motility protein PilT